MKPQHIHVALVMKLLFVVVIFTSFLRHSEIKIRSSGIVATPQGILMATLALVLPIKVPSNENC